MGNSLRADTEIILTVGPFQAYDDPLTPVTDVSLASADIARLVKHGSSSSVDISGATWAAKTNMDGYYNLTLTTSWLDTEGTLKLVFQDADVFMPLEFNYMVENAPSWDSKFAAAGTDYLPVDVNQWLGQAVTADNNVPEVHVVGMDDGVITADKLGADCITSAKIADDAIGPEHIGSGAVVADTLAADCITSAKIADDAISSEHFATDSITSDALAASACTKIIDDFETQSQADPSGFHVNVLEINGTVQTANDNGADINAILADSNELQGLITDSKIAANVSSIGSGVDFSATMKTSINTEVVDVMAVDTHSEPSQGAPPAAPTYAQMLIYWWVFFKNMLKQDNDSQDVYDDAGTTILFKAAVSSDGSTFTKGKFGSGA